MRNFIRSTAPFVLACFPQGFTYSFTNRQLVRFECHFDQLSTCVNRSDVSKKTSHGVEPGSFYLSDRKKCKVRKQLNKQIDRELGDSRSWQSPETADNVWRLVIQILLR